MRCQVKRQRRFLGEAESHGSPHRSPSGHVKELEWIEMTRLAVFSILFKSLSLKLS